MLHAHKGNQLLSCLPQDKTHKVKVKKETVNGPAVYKFRFQRKR